MNKLIVASVLVGLSGLSNAGSVCGNLADYDVRNASFSTSAKDAIARLLDGTPFSASFSADIPKTVSAKNVSGPLDQVLDALSAQAEMRYSLDRCMISFEAIPPKIDLSLHIQSGDFLSVKLKEWAKRNGYELIWDAAEFRADSPLVLDSGFEKDLNTLASSMSLNDIHLSVSIYENHVVRIKEAK